MGTIWGLHVPGHSRALQLVSWGRVKTVTSKDNLNIFVRLEQIIGIYEAFHIEVSKWIVLLIVDSLTTIVCILSSQYVARVVVSNRSTATHHILTHSGKLRPLFCANLSLIRLFIRRSIKLVRSIIHQTNSSFNNESAVDGLQQWETRVDGVALQLVLFVVWKIACASQLSLIVAIYGACALVNIHFTRVLRLMQTWSI